MPRPVRRQEIEDELKRRIRTGVYPAAGRIPSRRELLQEFDVSPVTMQRALDQLTEQGFVVPQGSRGTFVADQLPNVARFALVFAEEPGKGAWNRFWSTVQREAAAWRDAAGRTFAPYFIAGEDPRAEAHRQLRADLAAGRLAGILFASNPWFLGESPIFSAPVPRVVIGGNRADVARFSASAIEWMEGFGPTARMCERLVREGRRRIGAIVHRAYAEEWRTGMAEALRAGLEARPSWWVGLPPDPSNAMCARGMVRLLLDRPADQRPDALFIGDDNFVPHATAGIVDLGILAPGGISVLAHANYPTPTRSAVPCLRFGIDVRTLLQCALGELERLRQGDAPRRVLLEASTVDDAGESAP